MQQNNDADHLNIPLLLCGFFLVYAFELLFLLNIRGDFVGHDYHYFIPRLIDGLLFFRTQGLSIPWYTPSFCGGIPFYADPQSIFYSLPQFLALLLPPWEAVQISVVCFMIIGGVGMWLLLRRVINLSEFASYLGTLLFISNGFYAMRMSVGHVTYQAFMTAPLLLFALTSRQLDVFLGIGLIAFISANFVHSGGHVVSLIVLLSCILALPSLWALPARPSIALVRTTLWRLVLGGMLGFAMSSPKVISAYHLTINQNRSMVFDGLPITQAGRLFLSQLFWPGTFTPFEWGVWEYNSALSPLAIFGLLLFVVACVRSAISFVRRRRSITVLQGICIVGLCLAIPAIAILSTGAFNFARLSQANWLAANLRMNLRFTAAFILPICLWSALGFSTLQHRWWRSTLVILAFVVCPFVGAKVALTTQAAPGQYFDKSGVTEFYRRARFDPLDELRVQKLVFGKRLDDFRALETRASNINCYFPLFISPPSLLPGPPELVENAQYNFINPACYVFPSENNCSPGDRISTTDRQNLEHLLSHQNPRWKFSPYIQQSIVLAKVAFVMGLAVLILGMYRTRRHDLSSSQ